MHTRLWGIMLKLWSGLPLPDFLRWMLLWAGNQKFLVGTAAFILNEQGQVLLFKHTYRGKFPWGLPGGWLTKGENPAQAVAREILEESGLVARILQPLWVDADCAAPSLDLVFSGQLEGGVFRPSVEVSEMRFFDLEHLPELPANHRKLILKLNKIAGP